MTKQPYATTFPLITVNDMVSIQFKLLDYLGIDKVSTEDY
jgi:homoserine acetyltransferase